MPTLLMRLAGPMQSWGLSSRFTIRETGREPSKSGVVGLLCAALGKPNVERSGDGFPTLAQLSALRMGVRADREGTMARDYHTSGGGDWHGRPYGVYKASGKSGDPLPSTRFYLSDAHFLVGLEGPLDLLHLLDQALRRPVWQLSLGRKAFLPSIPVHLPDRPPEGPGLRDESLAEALRAVPLGHPLDAGPEQDKAPARIRLILDSASTGAGSEQRSDVPLDFSRRKFGTRRVSTEFAPASAFPGRSPQEASAR